MQALSKRILLTLCIHPRPYGPPSSIRKHNRAVLTSQRASGGARCVEKHCPRNCDEDFWRHGRREGERGREVEEAKENWEHNVGRGHIEERREIDGGHKSEGERGRGRE